MFLGMGKNGYGVFLFFASMQIASAVFVWFLVPETKAVPLERMDRLFEIKPAGKANGTIIAEIRAEEEEFRHEVEDAGVDVARSKLGQLESVHEKL